MAQNADAESDAATVFTIEGKSLRLDSAADVQSLVEEVTSRASTLTEIRLSGNTFGVEACRALAAAVSACNQLEKCVCSDMFTGRLRSEIPQCVEYFVQAMLDKPRLHHIDFSDNAFGPDGLRPLTPLIGACKGLHALLLNNTGLGPEGGRMLARALIQLRETIDADNAASSSERGLRVLVVGRSRLESGSMPLMAQALSAHGRTLSRLSFPQNGIRPDGVRVLMAGLQKCTALIDVDLQDNTFTVKGARALAEALPCWKQVRRLNVGDCMLGARGSLVAVAALSSARPAHLADLNLQYNEMGEDGALALAAALSSGALPALNSLELNGNCFEADGAGADAVRSALADESLLGSLSDMEEPDSDEELDDSDGDAEAEGDESEEEDLSAAMAKVSVEQQRS